MAKSKKVSRSKKKDKKKAISKIKTCMTPKGMQISIGMIFIEKREGRYHRIDRIGKEYPHSKEIKAHVEALGLWHYDDGEEREEWSGYGWIELSRFDDDYSLVDKPFEEFEAEKLAEFMDPDRFELPEGDPNETALIAAGSKDHVNSMKTSLEVKKQRVNAIMAMAHRQLARFDSIRRELEDQLKTIYRVIDVIELYLGVYEQVVQICDGLTASPDEPISFRQQVLYMDEEVGDFSWRNGVPGIDYQRVEDFDKWVVEQGGLAVLLPEPKGVVALRISRQKREYSDSWIENAQENNKNKYVYILIRNGERLYRIWTGTQIHDRLFPAEDELTFIFDEARKSGWSSRERDAENHRYIYQRNVMILQGLFDRTEIFQPMKHAVNLIDPDTYDGLIRFIRDDEAALTDGRIPFIDWKKQINAGIKRGSRIFMCDGLYGGYGSRKYLTDRFRLNVSREQGGPPLPESGVYSVDSFTSKNWDEKSPTEIRAGLWYF